MKPFAISIPMKPSPKQRPRSRMINGRMITFTPKKTREYENAVCDAITEVVREWPYYPGQRCRLSVVGGPSRADVDNLYKAVADALNGLIYTDDKQVEVGVMLVDRKVKTPYLGILCEYIDDEEMARLIKELRDKIEANSEAASC